MIYASILQSLKAWVEGTSINGKKVYCEICLEDEMELNPKTTSPCVFICPIPFDMLNYYTNKYNFRIYVAENATPSPNNITGTGTTLSNRMIVYNECVVYAENLIRALPESWLEEYPITITPVLLLWDTFDGIQFDISINNYIDCAEITLTGTTGNQFVITPYELFKPGVFAYLSGVSAEIIPSANTFIPITGTFVNDLTGFTFVNHPTYGVGIQLQDYIARPYLIQYNATLHANKNGRTITLGIKKNGVLELGSLMSTYIKIALETSNISGIFVTNMVQNDHIQLVKTSSHDGDEVTLHYYTTVIKPFSY